MKVIIGLGNPGKQYELTRHNLGFMAVEELRKELKGGGFRTEAKFKAEICRLEFSGEKIILVRPQTFMNLSGEAVRLLKHFYKISNEDIWVVYDDVDLPLGVLRIREDGSAGTHNGMKSIIQTTASEVFPRFRLGIESRGVLSPGQQEIASFVLEPFRNEELPQVREGIDLFVKAVVLALKKSILDAKNVFSK
ncbi:MAG: peptidyl-tRNA hydrolase, peptidyl-tRNA hydrolase, PTH1 family [Candidatus Peregrinibacteria bacterium GW2011_GWE2_39_6]|nr:MAG: peptidyl-tRNA hydrolase, peptidyl-tRNA hydrolase, PTH1 family [Candidatus Peregrinibacteria bacterium GW2011_GWF2_39_17]KKR25820.1 MAG: peptidyl-tRNA hydrolase, peptidyl-tRNA hydrolase, PTH1 family [Candidatus Peregrinibacteria bacterium GW2011_GWE2_39_6]HCW32275.1 aminoacyl-tRNA hydrolase [Candidatus Peregrinibacteria bacterium]